jgi:DtxR family Mn-dependent transcriptional regulator
MWANLTLKPIKHVVNICLQAFYYYFRCMPELSFTEENYLKSIYSLQFGGVAPEVSVNEIAERMHTRPATVTDMLRKLSDKKLINYERYKKTSLTKQGAKMALQIIRKHRLWEVFLYTKLNFSWDEVHEVAEELEHIRSTKLIEKLDEYLGFPRFDPHGDPIPNASGEVSPASNITLAQSKPGDKLKLVAVKDTSSAFLQHLERYDLYIGVPMEVKELLPFDKSIIVKINNGKLATLSEKITLSLLVIPC